MGGYLSCLGVVHLERLGAQRLKTLQCSYRLKLQFFLGVDFVPWGNPQHISGLAHTKPLGLQNNVQCLVPRYILKPQSHRTCHGVRRDDVEICEVSDDLQQRTNFNILEIERQFLAVVPWTLCQLARINFHRFNFNYKLIISLVSTVNPIAFGFNHHAHTITSLERRDILNRRTKISDIQTTTHTLRQGGFHEFNHQGLPLLANVHTHLVVRQCDNDPACTFITPTEIQIFQRQGIATSIFSKHGGS